MTKSRNITRRDYLNGMALLAASAVTMGSRSSQAQAKTEKSLDLPNGYYPPTLTGMRGSHKGSFEASHALGWNGELPEEYTDFDEEYDMVVVGAGISGLAAAYFYQQQAGKDKRILILDNHDDFGGHAKRNEFHFQDKMFLGAGGSGNFQNAYAYSDETMSLIKDLGFDLDNIRAATEPEYFGLNQGMYTDRENFGEDNIAYGNWMYAWHGVGNYQELVNALPLERSEKAKLISFIEGSKPLKKELPTENLRSALRSISYKNFLTDYVGLDEKTCVLWHPYISLTYLVGSDCLSIREAIKLGMPGLSVLSEEAMVALELSDDGQEEDFVWFPDGNATFCRQIVRRMIPRVASGTTIDDLIAARFDYSKLDRADHYVQLRLNSTVVNAANNKDQSVSISYVANENAFKVKSKRAILACYNNMITYMCPELPEQQKEQLQQGVKGPMLIANVLLRDGQSFYNAESEIFQCPTSPFTLVSKAPPLNIGDYKSSSNPKDPVVIYMLGAPAATPNDGSQTVRDLYRQGRYGVYAKSFGDYEKEIRDQLTGMFAANGFDADRDIEAITLNRWSHGYAYTHFELFDPKWPAGEAPHELGRKPFGNITIANSDSEGLDTVDGAVNAAWRSVQEHLKG